MKPSSIFSILIGYLVYSAPVFAAIDHCPDEKNYRCEYGQWYTTIEFFPSSFQASVGALNQGVWFIPKSEGFRAGCTVRTPELELVGPGVITGTINFSGSFQDWINSPSDFNQLYLFELVLSYLDEEGKRQRKSDLIPVQELGHLHLIGSDPAYGDFYFATSADELRQRTIRLNIEEDAVQIKLAICGIFPGTTVRINSLQIDTYAY
ncbi:MAG: hypothetical protein ACOH5I_14175 [Oligoflexus sp.]